MSREEGTDGSKEGIDLAAALRFVVLLGFVSMFADATYESSRSITGPYLATLGAGAAIVGIVAGLSELADYGLRFLSGYLTDRTRKYWLIAFIGFGLNMAAVPLLALAVRWELAAALILAERTGKAIRNPARDTMLSTLRGPSVTAGVSACKRLSGRWVRSSARSSSRPSFTFATAIASVCPFWSCQPSRLSACPFSHASRFRIQTVSRPDRLDRRAGRGFRPGSGRSWPSSL